MFQFNSDIRLFKLQRSLQHRSVSDSSSAVEDPRSNSQSIVNQRVRQITLPSSYLSTVQPVATRRRSVSIALPVVHTDSHIMKGCSLRRQQLGADLHGDKGKLATPMTWNIVRYYEYDVA